MNNTWLYGQIGDRIRGRIKYRVLARITNSVEERLAIRVWGSLKGRLARIQEHFKARVGSQSAEEDYDE